MSFIKAIPFDIYTDFLSLVSARMPIADISSCLSLYFVRDIVYRRHFTSFFSLFYLQYLLSWTIYARILEVMSAKALRKYLDWKSHHTVNRNVYQFRNGFPFISICCILCCVFTSPIKLIKASLSKSNRYCSSTSVP